MVSTLIARIVRFARPNIQIYNAHAVDLYQWVCAQYRVGVKGCRNEGKAQLSSTLDRDSEWITQVLHAVSKKQKFN